MVGIGVAAAGPAHIRDVDFAQGLHYVQAQAALPGHAQTGLNPEAAVDAAPQVLGKLTVYIFANKDFSIASLHRYRHRGLGQGGRYGGNDSGGQRKGQPVPTASRPSEKGWKQHERLGAGGRLSKCRTDSSAEPGSR
ncbi:hypothetical protein [Hymenobacter sp. BRD67]|uniref:hypothetical protein n=1 Tax=Hymenobacter sp. BRD67 TaxID=2675877 RepID=UPI001C25B1B9|nr:hypothetical protein [Hymenobacter sp. BRD67]